MKNILPLIYILPSSGKTLECLSHTKSVYFHITRYNKFQFFFRISFIKIYRITTCYFVWKLYKIYYYMHVIWNEICMHIIHIHAYNIIIYHLLLVCLIWIINPTRMQLCFINLRPWSRQYFSHNCDGTWLWKRLKLWPTARIPHNGQV